MMAAFDKCCDSKQTPGGSWTTDYPWYLPVSDVDGLEGTVYVYYVGMATPGAFAL